MTEFHFLRPWWFLALLPMLLILIAHWRNRSGGSAWRAVLDPVLLERLWLEPPGRVSRLPLWLLALGWLLAVLALAGPVWERQPEPIWQTESSRILILDLSNSMDAADLAPSRLERARYKILDILAKSREGRTGLVVFAGEPHVVTPLTDDGDTIANLLSALSTDIIPTAGDTGASALQMAGDLLQQAGVSRGELLLLSDGLADPAAALRVVHHLREQGHRLSVLGVGTVQGAPVPRADGGFGDMAKLPVDTLQELARAGAGSFSLLTADDRDLAKVLLEPHRSDAFQEMEDTGVERWVERGAWLLPLVLMLAAAGFRRGWLAGVLVIMILPPPVHALEWRDLWWRQDQLAAKALEQGQAEQAAGQFVEPGWRGMAHYEAGDYAAAAESFAESTGVDAGYNRGNALARGGQLTEAADAYRQMLEQAPEHADARANLELVEKLLQQQEQQQSNQEQSADNSSQEQDQQQQSESSEGEGQQGQEGQQQQQAQEQTGDSSAADKDKQEAQTQEEQSQAQADADQEQDPENNQSRAGNEADTQPQEQEDSMAAARRDVADQAQSQDVRPESEQEQGAQLSAEGEPTQEAEPLDESEQALQQWLRQIPEDPAGLLRRKFMVEHLRRIQQAELRNTQ